MKVKEEEVVVVLSEEDWEALLWETDEHAARAEVVVEALRWFKRQHGHLRVRFKYVVPEEAEGAGEGVRGMKLGNVVCNIRSKEHHVKGCPERRAELDALGFVWDARAVQPSPTPPDSDPSTAQRGTTRRHETSAQQRRVRAKQEFR